MPSENPPIDPRYDPRFQRGYQAADAAPAPRASTSGVRPTSSGRRAQRDAALAEPAPEPDRPALPDGATASAGAALAETPATPPAPQGSAGPEPEVEYHGPAPRRSNPWLVALWAIGVGFVVLGVGMIVVVQSINQTTVYATSGYGDPTPKMFIIFMNVAYSASGPLITVGLGTIVALLFQRALGRRG
jgi:hypothetical protein